MSVRKKILLVATALGTDNETESVVQYWPIAWRFILWCDRLTRVTLETDSFRGILNYCHCHRIHVHPYQGRQWLHFWLCG